MKQLWSSRSQASAGLGLVALLVAWLVACGTSPEPERASSPNGPRSGGTIVSIVGADLDSVNPYLTNTTSVSEEIYDLLFLRLMEEVPDLGREEPELHPRLAERWELDPERKTATFHLRNDVVWSDGTPVTAEDVRFTWQAQVHPDVAWESSFYKEEIRDAVVVDPHTVRFDLERMSFNQLLRLNEGVIIPRHAWGQVPFSEWRMRNDWFRQNLVVSGPFQIGEWVRQQQIVFERNPRYFQAGRPYLDRLVLRISGDRSVSISQLRAGEVDIACSLSVSDVGQVKDDPRLKVLSFWSRSFVFVAWNVERPLLKDAEVRRALAMAIDRQAIVDTTYGAYGRIAVSPVVSESWAFDHNLPMISYDLAGARAILDRRGIKDSDGDGIREDNGKPFSIELSLNTGNQQRADAAILIQQQLRHLGVDVRLRYELFNSMIERVKTGDFDALMMRWSMPTDLDYSFGFHSKEIGTSGMNQSRYRNPEVDRLLEETRELRSTADVRRNLKTFQQIVQQDQPITPIYELQEICAIDKRIHGGQPNASRRYPKIAEWWLEPKPARK